MKSHFVDITFSQRIHKNNDHNNKGWRRKNKLHFEIKNKFRNSKIFSKRIEKISNLRKYFEKKNSTSKLIFLLRSKKIHFDKFFFDKYFFFRNIF